MGVGRRTRALPRRAVRTRRKGQPPLFARRPPLACRRRQRRHAARARGHEVWRAVGWRGVARARGEGPQMTRVRPPAGRGGVRTRSWTSPPWVLSSPVFGVKGAGGVNRAVSRGGCAAREEGSVGEEEHILGRVGVADDSSPTTYPRCGEMGVGRVRRAFGTGEVHHVAPREKREVSVRRTRLTCRHV